jgi:signal transduction histidine kinase
MNTDVALKALATPATEPTQLAELCRQALNVDAVIFWTRRGRQLRTFAIAPKALDEISVDMAVGRGLAGRVAEIDRRVIIRDMLDPGEMSTKGFELQHTGVVREHGWRAGMFVPVRAGRRMVGVFGAYSKTVGMLKRGAQEHVFGAFANRVASELHRDAISDEFDRVTALGLAAIDRAHSIDNVNFALTGAVDRLEKLYKRRLETIPEFATPEIRRTIASIVELSSQVGSNFEALIHQDRLRRSSRTRVQPIESILRNAVARHAASAEEKDIALSLTCTPNIVAYVRSNDLDRVIENLIINAIYFHSVHESRHARHIQINAAAVESPRSTIITVDDNGPGIHDDELAFIFDLMWSSPQHGGSGFGLFFARRIIEAFGGAIYAESNPFTQTRFTIELNR